MSTLCKIYFKNWGFYTYQIAIVIYFFGTIWGYAQVVASSLTSVIPFTFLPNYAGTWVCTDPCHNYTQVCSDAYWIWISVCLLASLLVFVNLSD